LNTKKEIEQFITPSVKRESKSIENLYNETTQEIEEKTILQNVKETRLIIAIENVSNAEFVKLKEKINIILFTATNVERDTILDNLRPLKGYDSILASIIGNETHYVGCFGSYNIVLIMCYPGITHSNSIHFAGYDALDFWKPKIAILYGICFGLYEEDQQIGDVIVAEQVINYERVREGEEKIDRGEHAPCDPFLLNLFRSIHNWEYDLGNRKFAKIIIGPFLSGEKLINNIEKREDLKKRFRKAVGGDMEAIALSGLISRFSATKFTVGWIVVKGICDMGYNKTDEFQELAADSAVSLLSNIFNNPYAFENLAINSGCD